MSETPLRSPFRAVHAGITADFAFTPAEPDERDDLGTITAVATTPRRGSPVRFAPMSLKVAAVVAASEAGAAALTAEPSLWVGAALTVALALAVGFGRMLEHRGHPGRAEVVAGASLSVIALLGALLIPGVAPAASLIPALTVALVLPYAKRRQMPWILATAIGWSALTLIAGALPHRLAAPAQPFRDLFPAAVLLGVSSVLVVALVDFGMEARRSLVALRRSLDRARAVFDGSIDAILVANDQQTYVEANPAAEALLGVSCEDLVGHQIGEFVLGDQSDRDEDWREFLRAGEGRRSTTVRRSDGSTRTIDASSRANFIPGQHLTIWRDVTDFARVEGERSLLADAVGQAVEAIAVLDSDLGVIYANSAFATLADVPVQAFGRTGSPPELALPAGAELLTTSGPMRETLVAGAVWSGEIQRHRPDGSGSHAQVTISPVRHHGRAITNFVLVGRDISELRDMERARAGAHQERAAIAASLRTLAEGETPEATARAITEALTRLPAIDVAAIMEVVEDGRLRALAVSGSPLVTVQPGEFLPDSRSAYLLGRSTDGPWAEAWSGDEGDAHSACLTRAGVRAQAYAPLHHGGALLGLIACATLDERHTEHLVRDLPAVGEFAATATGILASSLIARRDAATARRRTETIVAMAAFRPVFQAIVELGSGRTVGFEALTRFDNGRAPEVVFRDATRGGMGSELERRTLTTALRESRHLPAGAWLSLNVSPSFLLDIESLRSVLSQRTRPIVLEITEHEVIADYAAVRETVRQLGPDVRLAVDDAGAGVANFAHIVELRPDFVKIDASLVRGVNADVTRQALIVGLRHFAAAAGCEVIAEGIETDAETQTLVDLGITLGQGFLLARPASARCRPSPRARRAA